MDDRQILEMAAKAAGFDFEWRNNPDECGLPCMAHVHNGVFQEWWRPLDDDGDALRLAVKMRFEIQCYPGMAGVIYDDGTPDGGYIQQNPEKGQSDGMAVRRAIVRAAAEMAMEAK